MKKYSFICMLLLIACTKEDDEQLEPEQTGEHVSVINNTSKWENVAYSEDIFSGRVGYSFESEIELNSGGIENGLPTFMAKHQFRRSGGFEEYDKFHVVSGSKLLNYTLPQNLSNTSPSQLPPDIQTELGTGRVDEVSNRYFRANGKVWSQGNLIDARFNTTYPVYDATLLKNENSIYGWINRMRYADFPSGYVNPVNNPSTDFVSFQNIGELDVASENGRESMYVLSDFGSIEGGRNPHQRGIICKKDLNSNQVEIDQISILPYSTTIENERFPSYFTVAYNDNKIFGIFKSNSANKAEIYYGSMNAGFQLTQTINGDIFQFEIIRGDNEFYLIYNLRVGARELRALKFKLDGSFSDLGIIPEGSYAIWNGDLLIGTENDSNEIEIIKLNANGVKENLAQGGDISVGDATGIVISKAFAFASDNNNLFVAVQNWKSPKYKGAVQFGGWEIIKYKN